MSQSKYTRTYGARKKGFSECRFCATNMDSKQLIDLTLEANSLTYKEIISVLKLDVDLSNNKLPKAACMECNTKCVQCYNFFLTVRKTQETLSVMYENKDNKTEMQDGRKGLKKNVLETNKQNNHVENSNILFTDVDTARTREIPVLFECGAASNPSGPRLKDTNSTSNQHTRQTNLKNSSNDKSIEQSYVEPSHSGLDDGSRENVSESKTMLNTLSTDISMNMYATQNIYSEDTKPVKQNIDNYRTKGNSQSTETNSGPNTQISEISNIDNEECEIKPAIEHSIHTAIDIDFNVTDVKIEDIGEEISNTDNSVLPANLDDINNISMEAAFYSINKQEIKSEIVNEKDSNIDNMACGGLDNMLNVDERKVTFSDIIHPIENIHLADIDIKTEIHNSEDFDDHNYASETSVYHFEEDNPLAINNDTIYNDDINIMSMNTLQDPNNEEGSLQVQGTNNDENLEQKEHIVGTVGNAASDLTPDGRIANYVDPLLEERVLLNNSSSDMRYKNIKSYSFIKRNKHKSGVLLSNTFLMANLHPNPNVVKVHKPTKRNYQKNKTLLNKSDSIVASHAHLINIAELDEVTKEYTQKHCMLQIKKGNSNKMNVKLLNNSNSSVTNSKAINVGELNKVTKENNQSNAILIQKSNTAVTNHGTSENIVVISKEIKNQNDFQNTNIDDNTLILQCSTNSQLSQAGKRGNNENDSTLLNAEKAIFTNDKNITLDNKFYNNDKDDNSTINEDNLPYDKEPHRITEERENDVYETFYNNDKPQTVTNKIDSVQISKSITPWRFDHEDIAENDSTKTPILWKKTCQFNDTLKTDMSKIIQQYIELSADKEISRIDPDNEFLLEKSWKTYPWCCWHCDAMFDCVEDLRCHKQYVHKRCSGFQCWDCKDKFPLFGKFVEHVRIHRHYLRLFCEHCNQRFPDKPSYLNHTPTHQSPYRCRICGDMCSDETELKEHCQRYKVKSKLLGVKDQNKVPEIVLESSDMTWKDYEWKCLKCSKVERGIQSLRAHAQAAHQQCFAAACADCPRDAGQTLRAFVRHVRLHRPYLRHFCYHCDKNFSSFADLTAHTDQHVWSEHLCSKCGESFEDEHMLRQHIKQFWTTPSRAKPQFAKNKNELLCHFCGRLFKSLNSYRVHLGRHSCCLTKDACHTCDKMFGFLPLEQHTDENLYCCNYCKKQFERKKDIRKHMSKHKDIKRYTCPTCSKNYYTTQDNIPRVKTERKQKTYICDYCGKTYKTREGIKEHLVKHVSEKKQICKICDKRFHFKCALKTHAATHVIDKPYSCDHCQKRFKSKQNIRAHVRSHMDIKPHACSVCGKAFRAKCNLIVHERIHTNAKPFKCEKCDKTFRDCPRCDAHMRRVHGVSFFRTKITERGRVEIDRRSGETRKLDIDDEAQEWLRQITAVQNKN